MTCALRGRPPGPARAARSGEELVGAEQPRPACGGRALHDSILRQSPPASAAPALQLLRPAQNHHVLANGLNLLRRFDSSAESPPGTPPRKSSPSLLRRMAENEPERSSDRAASELRFRTCPGRRQPGECLQVVFQPAKTRKLCNSMHVGPCILCNDTIVIEREYASMHCGVAVFIDDAYFHGASLKRRLKPQDHPLAMIPGSEPQHTGLVPRAGPRIVNSAIRHSRRRTIASSG